MFTWFKDWMDRRNAVRLKVLEMANDSEKADLRNDNDRLKQENALLTRENELLNDIIERDRERVQAETAHAIAERESLMAPRKPPQE